MADSKLSALAELAAANVDYAADLVYVVDTSATTSGSKKVSIDSLFSDITCAIGVDTANGIDYNPPGGDVDVDLITVGVTDSPRLWWDESADQFALTKPLNVNGAGFMPVYATEAARDVAIPSPVEGQVVFITDGAQLSLYTGGQWVDSFSFFSMATYPAYDNSADASTWFYGLAYGLANAGPYVGISGSASDEWVCHTIPITLQPGTYYLTELGIHGGYTTTDDLTAVRFAIFEDAAGELTPITFGDASTYVDMTADIAVGDTANQDIGPTTVASVPFTIEAGKSYQMGFALHGAVTRDTSRPGIHRMTNLKGPQGLTSYFTEDLGTFPVAHTGAVNSSGELPRGYMKFTTPVRKLFSQAYSSATDMLIPRRTDGAYCIKFKDAVVADGEALTVAMDYDSFSDDGVRTTLVLDMGATDQVTFGSADVALAGAGAEAGDTFDLLAEFRGATGKADLFWQNKTTGQGPLGDGDFATFSHRVKDSGTRGLDYTITGPQYLKITGTAAVAAIEVGWQPVVIFGDSQSHKTGEGGLTTSATERLGYYLPLAFEYPRIYWLSYMSGNFLTIDNGVTSTAGYLRYKATTPGEGDLCEMTSPLFVISGYGVNDIALIGTTETNRNKVVSLFATRVGEILDDLQDRAIPTLIIGIPPYSSAGSASEQEAQAVKQLNLALFGLACGVRAAYYNPWSAMCEDGTAGDAVPTFDSAYTVDAGLHYNATGAALVAASAASALENGLIGG